VIKVLSFKDDEIFGGYSINEVLITLNFPFEAILKKFYAEKKEDALKVINDFAKYLFFLVKVYNDVFGDTYDVFVKDRKVYLRHKGEDIWVLNIQKDSQDKDTYRVFNNLKPLIEIINKILKHFNTSDIIVLRKLMRAKEYKYTIFFNYNTEVPLDFNQLRKILKGKEVEVIYEYPLIINNIRIDGWYPKKEKILFDNLNLKKNSKNIDIKALFVKEGLDFDNNSPIPDLREFIDITVFKYEYHYIVKSFIIKPDNETLSDIKKLIIMEKLGGGLDGRRES
jgi:hypothetical protein